MIASFRHKGLEDFYRTGSMRGIQPLHAKKLLLILTFLDAASAPQDMNVPGFRLHPLQGDLANFWSVRVTGNWRVIFTFEAGEVHLVDYLDYH